MCEKDLGALPSACELADWVELRIDCFDEVPDNLEEIKQPLILTFRPSEQGGYRELTREQRQRFWSSAPRSDSVWWDVEGDLVHELAPDWSRVIVSHHDFSGVPKDLEQI